MKKNPYFILERRQKLLAREHHVFLLNAYFLFERLRHPHKIRVISVPLRLLDERMTTNGRLARNVFAAAGR